MYEVLWRPGRLAGICSAFERVGYREYGKLQAATEVFMVANAHRAMRAATR